MLDVFAGFEAIKGVQVVIHGYALRELLQVGLAQGIPQFRLADQHELQHQVLIRIDIGDDA